MDSPKIRFKGYTDAWEQRKLGNVAEIVGGGTPNTNVPEYWDGNIDWYAPAEISDQIYLDSSQRKITEEGYNNCSAKILPVGTVLFTSRAGIGKTAILSQKACTNQGFQSIVPHKDKLDSYFIFSRGEELKRHGETVGAGSTFVEVSGKQMADMNLMLPKTIREQQVIGSYFKQLDHLITLHQRKCEQTKKLKKYMLQKMFPKDGANVPEIRFSGFTDAWEQRKLGNVAKFSKGNGYSKGDLVDNGTPIILYGRLYTNYETTIKKVDTFVVEKENSVFSKGGEVIIPASGETAEDIARASAVENSGILLGGDLNIIEPEEYINSSFLALSISNGDVQKELSKKAQGKSVVHVRNDEIKRLVISFPNRREQDKIEGYFTRLDDLITLHQRKYEELQKIKKFMLQNLFV